METPLLWRLARTRLLLDIYNPKTHTTRQPHLYQPIIRPPRQRVHDGTYGKNNTTARNSTAPTIQSSGLLRPTQKTSHRPSPRTNDDCRTTPPKIPRRSQQTLTRRIPTPLPNETKTRTLDNFRYTDAETNSYLHRRITQTRQASGMGHCHLAL